MDAISKVVVEISVVLGKTKMPISQLLKMGRGAVIDLESEHEERCKIYANNELIGYGEVMMVGERIGVSITEIIKGYAE